MSMGHVCPSLALQPTTMKLLSRNGLFRVPLWKIHGLSRRMACVGTAACIVAKLADTEWVYSRRSSFLFYFIPYFSREIFQSLDLSTRLVPQQTASRAPWDDCFLSRWLSASETIFRALYSLEGCPRSTQQEGTSTHDTI